MKTIYTILFAWLCTATPLLAQAPTYFTQNFSSSSNYMDYASPSPTANQFTQLTTSGAGASVSINSSGKLEMTRNTGNQARFGRSAGLFNPTGPSCLYIQFKMATIPLEVFPNTSNLYLGGDASTGGAFGGNTFADNGLIPNSQTVYAGLQINFVLLATGSLGFRLDAGANQGNNYSGEHTITWALNNSGSTLLYAIPDATGTPTNNTASLGNDQMTVYVDGEQQFGGLVSVITASQNMNFFKFLFSQGLGTITMDDMNFKGCGNYASSILPVSLLNFNAQANENNTVGLKWATANEHNSSHFVVERSPNLDNFTEIARLDAAGNTTTQRNYHYTDFSPLIGTSYYRLRQIDIDGTEQLYRPVSVQVGNDVLQVFPNPVSEGEIFLQSSNLQILSIELLSATGEKMTIQHEICSENQQKLHLPSGMPPGLYMLAIHRADSRTTYRKIAVH